MVDRKAIVIGLCGAGGTGKTVVAKRILELVKNAYFMPSVVREYTAKLGITSEQDIYIKNPTPKDRYWFNRNMLDAYIAKIHETVEQQNAEVIVTDRTPFDHMAYTLFAGESYIELSHYKELTTTVNLAVETYFDCIGFFPYPASFTKDVNADKDPNDSFRWPQANKSLIVDALIRRAVWRMPFMGPRFDVGENTSVDIRTSMVLNALDRVRS